MNRLFDLPNEILDCIIYFASLESNRLEDDMLSLLGWSYPQLNHAQLNDIALSSRRLYSLTIPLLWREKEFILPHEQDTTTAHSPTIQMATDILSKQPIFFQTTAAAMTSLGDYVYSLHRDLTNGPQFDLVNTKLMAQLVSNLRALRMDFNPLLRVKHYGLCYFIQSCPQLTEIYLHHCKDTFDDFASLVNDGGGMRLESLTLVSCTIKEKTLERIANVLKPSLKRLLLDQVLIEPASVENTATAEMIERTNARLMGLGPIHPLHYQTPGVTIITPTLYKTLLDQKHRLTQLALTDSLSYTTLRAIVINAPNLEKLSIALHDIQSLNATRSIQVLTRLSNLKLLSLSFQKYEDNVITRLPCHAPSCAWRYFAQHLPPVLQVLMISTIRMVVDQSFIPLLFEKKESSLENVLVYNLCLVTTSAACFDETSERLLAADVRGEREEIKERLAIRLYLDDWHKTTDCIDAWNEKSHLYNYEQAIKRGFTCLEKSDKVCLIKGKREKKIKI